MNLDDYAAQKETRISRGALEYLHKQGFLENPLTDADLAFLARFNKLWGNRVLLRSQLRRLNKRDRMRLAESADIFTAWERYVYSRFLGHYMRDPYTRSPLHVATVVEEVKARHKKTVTPKMYAQILRLRRKARERAKYLRRARDRQQAAEDYLPVEEASVHG